MNLPAILSMLNGSAPLTLPAFPCAFCQAVPDTLEDDAPAQAVTIVLGTPVCPEHRDLTLRSFSAQALGIVL